MTMKNSYYDRQRLPHSCPACAGNVMRVRRHWPDRLVSKFSHPVQRYRCEQFGCGWEGLLDTERNANLPLVPMLANLTDDKLRRR